MWNVVVGAMFDAGRWLALLGAVALVLIGGSAAIVAATGGPVEVLRVPAIVAGVVTGLGVAFLFLTAFACGCQD